jgi:hypothetical protein
MALRSLKNRDVPVKGINCEVFIISSEFPHQCGRYYVLLYLFIKGVIKLVSTELGTKRGISFLSSKLHAPRLTTYVNEIGDHQCGSRCNRITDQTCYVH